MGKDVIFWQSAHTLSQLKAKSASQTRLEKKKNETETTTMSLLCVGGEQPMQMACMCLLLRYMQLLCKYVDLMCVCLIACFFLKKKEVLKAAAVLSWVGYGRGVLYSIRK